MANIKKWVFNKIGAVSKDEFELVNSKYKLLIKFSSDLVKNRRKQFDEIDKLNKTINELELSNSNTNNYIDNAFRTTSELLDDKNTFLVQTPFTVTNGGVLSFYVINQSYGSFLITDKIETAKRFLRHGLIGELKKDTGLADKIAMTNCNISMLDNGEIICIANQSNLRYIISNYIISLIGLMHYEHELLHAKSHTQNLIDMDNEILYEINESTLIRAI